METLLAMVGETLDDEDSLINGAIISIRPKANKVCLWIKNSLPAESITKVSKGSIESNGRRSWVLRLVSLNIKLFQIHTIRCRQFLAAKENFIGCLHQG